MQRVWQVLNVSLILIGLLLALNLFGIHPPTVGQVLFQFDTSEPTCSVSWQGDSSPLTDMGQCCLESRKQLSCKLVENSWICKTGGLSYTLNNKAYNICLSQWL